MSPSTAAKLCATPRRLCGVVGGGAGRADQGSCASPVMPVAPGARSRHGVRFESTNLVSRSTESRLSATSSSSSMGCRRSPRGGDIPSPRSNRRCRRRSTSPFGEGVASPTERFDDEASDPCGHLCLPSARACLTARGWRGDRPARSGEGRPPVTSIQASREIARRSVSIERRPWCFDRDQSPGRRCARAVGPPGICQADTGPTASSIRNWPAGVEPGPVSRDVNAFRGRRSPAVA